MSKVQEIHLTLSVAYGSKTQGVPLQGDDMTYTSNERLIEIAEDMQACFLVGGLHSRSSPNEVAVKAREHLMDEGLPYPRSVCFLVAKYARLIWVGEIEKVKALQDSVLVEVE